MKNIGVQSSRNTTKCGHKHLALEKKQILKCKSLSKKSRLQLKVFIPFCIVLAASIGVFIVLIQYQYLIPLSNNMEMVIWNNYKKYIKSLSKSERITLILTYQQIASSIQIIADFIKKIMINQVNISDLHGNQIQQGVIHTLYLIITNPNLEALMTLEKKIFVHIKVTSLKVHQRKIIYQIKYIVGITGERVYGKNQMKIKECIQLRIIFPKVFQKFFFNIKDINILKQEAFIMQNSLMICFQSFLLLRDQLLVNFIILKLLEVHFHVLNNQMEGIKNSNCQTKNILQVKIKKMKFAVKIKWVLVNVVIMMNIEYFQIVWRCRPWYIASSLNSYVTFTETYPDLDSRVLASSVSIKIVDSSNLSSINQEDGAETFAIQSMDLYLDRLQKNYGQGNVTKEYSYFVAASTFDYDDMNGSYYQYTVLVHPHLSGIVKQSILELEFENSTFAEEEKKMYQEKTQFLINTAIRYSGCHPFRNITKHEETIVKNGTNYYTLFQDVVMCYGNMFEQNTMTVGYLGKGISEERKKYSYQRSY